MISYTSQSRVTDVKSFPLFVVFCWVWPEKPRGDGLTPDQPNQTEIETNWDECIESFDAMDLREDLLRGIYAYGFEKPSAIQQVKQE